MSETIKLNDNTYEYNNLTGGNLKSVIYAEKNEVPPMYIIDLPLNVNGNKKLIETHVNIQDEEIVNIGFFNKDLLLQLENNRNRKRFLEFLSVSQLSTHINEFATEELSKVHKYRRNQIEYKVGNVKMINVSLTVK